MKLYITPGSPYARMARIVILEKGLESRVEIIVAKTRVADSPYYGINPSGRVPYLECADDMRLEESALICSYLDHLDGNPLMRGPLNMVQITLACALGLEARNPDFRWRPGRPKLCDWFERVAARPSLVATVPPRAPLASG